MSDMAASTCRTRIGQLPSARVCLLVALLVAFGGLFASSVLSLGHILDIPVPCGGSRGCAAVASHPRSKVMGVPIAYFGVAGYLVIIVLLAQRTLGRRGRSVLFVFTAVGAGTSLFLLLYSRNVIGATCHWCVGSGAAMGLLFLLTMPVAWRHGTVQGPRLWFVWGLAILTAMAIGLQAGAMQREATKPPISVERLAAVPASDLIDEAKSIGSSTAPVTIIVFADFWCPACRATHAILVNFARSNPAGVRLVYRHMPLWEASAAAAALSEIAAEAGQFWPFAAAMNAPLPPLRAEDYLDLLRRLGLDADSAEARIGDPQDPAVARVLRDMEIANQLGVRTTPTYIVLIDGQPPMSANHVTLPMIINSPAVQVRLALANKPAPEAP
jgi:protein-disulfide isomerase